MTNINQEASMKDVYLKDMELQWNDHFHMRDQTWKTLQYTIAIFLGVVGLQFKEDIDPNVLFIGNLALLATSVLGFIVALHHRERQKIKFELIAFYEEKLGLTPDIGPILNRHRSGVINGVNTALFICVGHAAMLGIAISMLLANSS